MAKATPLLARAQRELAKVADPVKAPQMQAYMKSAMPYHGVNAPALRAVCKQLFAEYAPASAAAWRRDVLALFRGAKRREERYVAVELSGVRAARPFQKMESLAMYEEMIVTGAWWDIVDALAVHRLDRILREEPGPMKRTMRAWSRSDDMWKRRSSILCQITFKKETDLPFLYACIEPSLGSKEFFLRKAIGWALRQYAWTDPEEVKRYVRAHEGELSGLSRREALKNV
jgi:3-methyladenine DNA glycosylase AlkD